MLDQIEKHQDAISGVADRIHGYCGGHVANDTHPAWPHTGDLPNSICRIVAIQLAENRTLERI